MGRVREEKRREEKRREEKRRKKVQVWEKVGKSRNTVFFQWFVAREGRKVGSLKRRVRGQLARWEMNNCTPLWREAHFEVKMYKAHHSRTTFGSWGVQKVHAVVARSTFRSENVQNIPFSDHFWKLRCPKSARRCGAKHISKWKCTKHTILGPLLEVEMPKKCTPLWREAHFEVKMYKAHHSRTTFGSWDVEKVQAVVAQSTFRSQNLKNTRGSDHFWRFRCRFAWQQRCIFRGRLSTRDMFIRDVRRSGHWFPERGCILEHQILSFGKMILRDRCSTSYDLASLFVAGTILWTGGVEKSQSALVRGRQLCTQLSIFEGSLAGLLRFWRCQLRKMKKSRRIFRFWRCQVQKLRRSRRLAPFLMLSSSKTEEVAQNSFVFKPADRQIDR